MTDIVFFLPVIFLIAFFYSIVGHGGASGYLALMALAGISTVYMRSSALAMNVVVSGIALYQFYRMNYFKWKILWPFLIASVPAAFLGASFTVNPFWYNKILGFFLLIAAFRILGFPEITILRQTNIHRAVAIIIGGFIGLLSGMIGIGGGILLSPVLLITKQANAKETSAVSAAFILLNSITGIGGLALHGNLNMPPEILTWCMAALAGGLTGSYLGSVKFKNQTVQSILACVLLIACGKLLFT